MSCADCSRRAFLGRLGIAGTAALSAGCEIEEVARLVDDMRTDVRLGVVANAEISWPDTTRQLMKAFAYFRQEGVDAVVLAGGATRNGYKRQIEVVQNAFWEAFGRGTKVSLILDEGPCEVKGFRFSVSFTRPFEKGETLTFHGAGKRELTNDLWFHDEENHTLYAGTLSGIVPQSGYEHNGRVFSGKDVLPASQGLLVCVRSQKIFVRRLDFTQSTPPSGMRSYWPIYAEDVAEELVLDRQTLRPIVDAEKPRAPEFWSDTQLKAIRGERNGRAVLTLVWPHVLKRFTGVRAFRYEVGLHLLPEGETIPHAPIVRRYVLTKGFHLSEARDLEPVSCFYDSKTLNEVRKAHSALVISVTPVSSLGLRGKPLYCTVGKST